MDLVLNELSLDVIASNVEEARARMDRLMGTIREARRLGADGPLRTVPGVHTREIASGYRVTNWLEDGIAQRESRELLRVLLAGAPYVPELVAAAENEAGQLVEYTFASKVSPGLGLADLLDAPAVSLQGDPSFQMDPITVHRRSISHGEDAEVLEELDVEVCNLAHAKHSTARGAWIAERLASGVQDGEDLWHERATLFPFITFCGDTERQLRRLTGAEPGFRQILRHLRVLSATTRDWTNGDFLPLRVGATRESESTLRHGVYGPKRKFQTPLGKVQFSWHTKLVGENLRIYFSFESGPPKTTYVAYVGPHLSTVRYPDLA
ncbi:MAG TPA: hypothetical protein VF710_11405 [Longimicrobium sp.]|jgi:hypothetical protein